MNGCRLWQPLCAAAIASHALRQALNHDYAIFLDPTVLAKEDTSGMRAMSAEIRQFIMTIPQRSTTAVFVIQNSMVNSRPRFEREFPQQTNTTPEQTHAALLAPFADSVAKTFEREWLVAHTSAGVKQATSCILSTLYLAARRAGRALSPAKQKIVYVVSDLVESCDDWGANVRFERGILDSSKVDRSALRKVVLAGIDTLTFVTIGSAPFATPRLRQGLEDWWKSVATSSQIKNDRVVFSGALPRP